ncbi:MAG: ABC transporter permease [Anaerolineaceae bacterium]|nr:MAG: ABC transporter permease [Anaerolineaceae bacterium]
MWVILRLAERNISRRFLQSLLFVLGVALGVAMIVAIDVANGSARRAFSLSADSVTGNTTHQIIGGPSGLPTELYRTVRVDLGIRESAPVIDEMVRALEFDNQSMRLFGVDTFAEAPFRGYLQAVQVDSENTSPDGFNALNRFLTGDGAVLVSRTIAERHGLDAGDELTIRAGSRAVTVQIVGLLQPNDAVSQQAIDDLLLADIATAQEILGIAGRLTRIDLILPEATADERLAQIEAVLPAGALVGPVADGADTLGQMTEAFELNLQALSLLALVVGAFLIYNTVMFSVVQRRPLIGIMRSLGFTQRQIFGLILSEAFLLGLVGTLLGLGLGVIFGRGAVNLVAQTISDLYFTVNVQQVNVPTFTLVKGAFVGVFASVGAALLPAWNATRTPPVGAMRRSDQEQSARVLMPYITAAALLSVIVGVVLLNLPTPRIEVSFAGLFAIVVGGAFFTPLVLVLVLQAVTPLTGALFGVVGRMAPRAVIRSLSRTSIAVAALTVAISVIVGVSVMIASFRNTVDDWLTTTLGGDIFISPPLLTSNQTTVSVDPAVRDILAEVEGVLEISAARSTVAIAPDFPDMPPVNLQAVESDIAPDRGFVWRDVDDYWAAMQAGAVMVSEPFAFRRGIDRDNNRLTLVTDRGVQTFDVVGVFYDYTTDQGRVLMAENVYRDLYDDLFITSVALFITPDAELDRVIENVRAALVGYDLSVQSNRDLRVGVFDVFDNAFAITVALRLLATLVAFIGILSALLSLQLENTRQYGVLRANGMTPRQLWDFTLIQTGLMGLVAGLLAIPIGLALSLVLLFVINVRSFGWTMDFYWVPREFIEAFMVAVVASLVAGVYPGIRMMRLVTARALRSE